MGKKEQPIRFVFASGDHLPITDEQRDSTRTVKTLTEEATKLLYRARALSALGADPAYDWLRAPGRKLTGILGELGRFENDDQIRRMAAAVCSAKKSTEETVERIRWARTKRTPAARSESLEAALYQCVRERDESHDAATSSWVIEAIDRLRARIAGGALSEPKA